jgi:hypothetical protein
VAGHPAKEAPAATAMRVGAARSSSMSGRYRVVGRIRRARDTSVVGAHPGDLLRRGFPARRVGARRLVQADVGHELGHRPVRPVGPVGVIDVLDLGSQLRAVRQQLDHPGLVGDQRAHLAGVGGAA